MIEIADNQKSSAANWLNIFCVGLVQACMGAVVVTTTTTLNRVMVIELALPALLPGFLIGLHYIIQMIRPRMGYGADQTKRFTPWITGGMLVLAVGGILAALATTLMAEHFAIGVTTALVGFCMIGMGVSACGTTLLVLLSKGVGDHQRATSATAVWIMMIFGFALTSIVSGKLLDPFSFDRLLAVSIGVSVLACTITAIAMYGLENRLVEKITYEENKQQTKTSLEISNGNLDSNSNNSNKNFKDALALLWRDDQARLFTFFVFSSMLAYSAQDLIMEPFAALIYHFTPGQTTQLSGILHASVLVGMLLLAFIGSGWVRGRLGQISSWMSIGCVLSAVGMFGLCFAAFSGSLAPALPLNPILMVLGVGNGLFSIAAISTMMRLATLKSDVSGLDANGVKPGIRMGLWGAAQAVAFGLGGLVGTGGSDLSMKLIGNASFAYANVFALEAVMFLIAAWIAWRVKGLSQESGASGELSHAFAHKDRGSTGLNLSGV